MYAWKVEMFRIINTALCRPSSPLELTTLALLALITYVLVSRKIGGALEIIMTDILHSLAATAVGVAAVLAVTAAANLYIVPGIGSPALRLSASIVAAALALLAIAVPAVCLIQKGSYLNSLFTILLSIAAALVVVLLVHAGFKAVSSGSGQVGKGVRHKKTLEEAMAQ
jgi:hypothetical protein